MSEKKLVFLGWATNGRRSQLMAKRLGGKLYFVNYLGLKNPLSAPARYALQAVKTFSVLRREEPQVVFVQNPPIFGALVTCLYCQTAGARYVIDSHTGAFLSPRWRWALPLHQSLSRRALSTLVTNEHLSSTVKAWGAPSLVVRDVPTDFGPGCAFPIKGDFVVTVVNSFSWDEPLDEILEAAEGLPDISFYVTGNPKVREKEFKLRRPCNVVFTGFIEDQDYIGLLRASHAVMALTTKDHTMQRGACEALSLGRPIITSDWGLLRDYFSRGTVHVQSSVVSIQQGVKTMHNEWGKLSQEIKVLKEEREREWLEKKNILCLLLGSVR